MRSAHHSESRGRPAPHPAQQRQPLTVDEILQLESALMELFRTIRNLRAQSSVARHIKFPSLPSVFSESIVIAATPLLFGSDWKGRYGGGRADVILENVISHRSFRAEIKATGRHAFQELKGKDLKADVLIWLRFGDRLELGSGPIEAAVLKSPGKYVKSQRRLDVRRFEAIPGIQRAQMVLRFESLGAMLAAPAANRDGTAQTQS